MSDSTDNLDDRGMAARVRAFDWSATPLGPLDRWPQPLRLAVDLCLASRFPMFVWWGPDLVNIYNDAYAPVLGRRHPDALGRGARAVWADLWPTIAEDVDGVMTRGEAVSRDRARLLTDRNGYPEEIFFTYSHSPIPDGHGGVGGLFQVCTDETARVLAERERDRMADQRQLALDAAGMGWWHLDPVSNVATFDRRFSEIFGITGHRQSNDELLKRLHPDDRPAVLAKVAAALDPADPTPHAAEFRIRLDDGSTRWVEAHGSATFGGDGPARRAVGLVGTVADVTARRDVAEQSRTILESISDAFFAVDRDWRFTYLNPQAERVLGLTLADTAGRLLWDVYPDLAESDFGRTYRRAADDGVAGTVTAYYPDHDRWYDAHAYPGPDGGVSVYFRNVTEQRRAEETLRESTTLLRAISDSTGDAIFAKDRDGRLRYANPATLALIGKPLDRVLGRTDAEFLDDPAAARLVMANDRRVMDAAEAADVEEAIPLPDGTERVWASRKIPYRDADGAVVGLLGVSRDVTDRRRAEAEREQLLASERAARAEAERQGRMKDEFLATLSHELRTPLNAIVGWASILTGGASDASDLHDGLETILRNARAQAQIIGDLLDMSRIVAGKVRLDVRRIDLAPVVRAAVDTVRPAADAKGVRLRVLLDPAAGPVAGDPDRLQQVLWNLLSNAVKFTPRGGQVQVVLERVNSLLEVAVADTGEGIPAEFLPFVFDRFRQADASTTRRHGGLGLGLAIVKQLVELHGGTVRVHSPGPGQGSTFTIAIPLTAVHPDPAPDPDRRHPAAPSGHGAAPDATRLTGVRVLVVDDEPDARALVKRLLDDCHATVTTAGSAADAMAQIAAAPPDVLVSDIGMPGQDGYALIAQVRALAGDAGGDVPAVALTAYARSEDRVRAIRAGFQTHVVKPVEPAELVAVVASLARRR